MAIEINQKITGFNVVNKPVNENNIRQPAPDSSDNSSTAEIIHMHEKLERPDMLLGSTYKIKTPLSDHALYITINDVVLNPGTEHEIRRPYEVFINSKNMEHFQWIVALTRIISAVFRKGGDVTFLVDELRSVFDPQGGYFNKGRYIPSLVAEIGDAIECHLKMIGMIKHTEMDNAQRDSLDAKRKEYESIQVSSAQQTEATAESDFPPSAQLCKKCYNKAVISMDGCMTCLNCGDSKCG